MWSCNIGSYCLYPRGGWAPAASTTEAAAADEAVDAEMEDSAEPAGSATLSAVQMEGSDAEEEPDSDEEKEDLHNDRKRSINPDELDDVDDWQDDEQDGNMPSERQQLQAKRSRRERRENDQEEDTNIDSTTSLATEGVAIEPFHMKEEWTDGTGFFDGDTYVFRKQAVDEEPDAWVDGLSEEIQESVDDDQKQHAAAPRSNPMEDWSREELIAKIISLVSDTETVLQALVRYGNLIKRQRAGHATVGNGDKDAIEMAKTALDELTGASSALLSSKGEFDIYEKTRKDLLELLPKPSEASKIDQDDRPKVSWEYRGNDDGKIHGPYSSSDMLSWTKAGYFVGSQAVQIRSVREKAKSTADDLLNDLMDDSDNEEGTKPELERGEWTMSDKVDFASYS